MSSLVVGRVLAVTCALVISTSTGCSDSSDLPPCSGSASDAWQRSPAANLVPPEARSCGEPRSEGKASARTAFLLDGNGKAVMTLLVERANRDGWVRASDNWYGQDKGSERARSVLWSRLRREREGRSEWLRIELTDLAARQRGLVLAPKSHVIVSYTAPDEQDGQRSTAR